ncbi:MAG: hypothetical protein KAU01_05850, partial [Candidatus Cloacimonetes bacterium]|nr:hypothetical protein [Candidatus Cloacimonadota bacterium]
HEATISWEISADYSYESSGDFPLFIAQIPVSLFENFDVFPPIDWSTEGGNNWIVSYSNFAGGTIPEAAFIWYPPIVGTQRLITMPIITLGSNELELEFKHALYDINGGYTISVETSSNGSNWNIIASWSAQNFPATTENFTISTPDVGSATFQLAFVFDGISEGINGWVIDDVLLSEAIISPHGYIVGNVSLDGGPGNIEEVIVTAGGVIKNPDSNGDYCIPVPQGTYDVSAILPGYITSIVEDVVVGEWETTVVDFVLYETTVADPPQNLQASLYFNDVTLEWDIPGSDNDNKGLRIPTKVDRNNGIHKSDFDIRMKRNPHFPDNRSLLGYKVYRDDEEIAEINDIMITTYFDPGLDAGEYSYYVTAIYNDGESDPSNIENVTVILPPPTNLTYQVNVGNMVILQWLPPEGEPSRNCTGYNVYRDEVIIAEDLSQLFYMDLNVPVGIHTYYITALYNEYESGPSNEVIVEITSTDDFLIPLKTELGNNFPNPFNPSGAGRSPRTTITFALKDAGHVYLEIFNIKGEKVKTLFDEKLEPGYHSVEWSGKDKNENTISSGIYFYKLCLHPDSSGKAEDFQKVKKMILIK